jgi:hypothetical protein
MELGLGGEPLEIQWQRKTSCTLIEKHLIDDVANY